MKKTIGSIIILASTLGAAPVLFQASGGNAGAIQNSVNDYRVALGTLNANAPATFNGGRREINWDGVPNAASSPNPFPGDFFNGGVAGRARGSVNTTPGTGFEVSSTLASGVPVEFGNIDPSYGDLFAPFSGQKLFTPIDSNITDVQFFLPSDQVTPAQTRGFGVVFSDVDLANTTSVEYFDILNNSLGKYFVPVAVGNETFSFFGLLFDDETRIGRVRITTGNAALGAGVLETATTDLVTMDDFIFAEPEAVPEPGTWMMLATGLAALGIVRKRRAV